MRQMIPVLIFGLLLAGCLGLEDIGKLFEKRTLGMKSDKPEYIVGDTVILTATADQRKYVNIGSAPFGIERFNEDARSWEALDVSSGPNPRSVCKGGQIEMTGFVKEEREACKLLEVLQYNWYGASWHRKMIKCGSRDFEEVRAINETGRIRASLRIYDDPECTDFNSTQYTEFQISNG
ncbi:MAG: hypothetical protein ABH863_05640 [Candidatus Micrarchaeota archaeon]